MRSVNLFSGNINLTEKLTISSYTNTCSKITTSNVVETTTRGGGVSNTTRVVILLKMFMKISNLFLKHRPS
ncbi:MAG: hypothetical protein FWG85_08010, partial [Bacteroidetes bacterium]|nr:hypothetical protein [Bacteroidota bacterium]